MWRRAVVSFHSSCSSLGNHSPCAQASCASVSRRPSSNMFLRPRVWMSVQMASSDRLELSPACASDALGLDLDIELTPLIRLAGRGYEHEGLDGSCRRAF